MIVELIEQQGLLLAVNHRGELLLWDISPPQHNRPLHFPHNVSILPSTLRVSLDAKELVGIITLGTHFLAFNRRNLYIAEFTQFLGLPELGKEGNANCIKQISMAPFLGEEESIRCLASISSEVILLGTDKGTVLTFNLSQEQVEVKASLCSKTKHSRDEAVFASSFDKPTEITSLILSKDKSMAMASLDSGRIFSLELQQLKIVNEVTLAVKSPLERITKLYLKEDEDKVYSLHASYILEWNYKLSLCLNYIEYEKPQGIIVENGSLAVVGPVPSLTILTGLSGEETSLSLSMRGAATIGQLGSQTWAVGGSDNFIDIFRDRSRLMTLIAK